MRAATAVFIAVMDRTGRSLKAGAGTGSMRLRATLFKTGHGILGQGPRLELVPEPRLPIGLPGIGSRTGQTPDSVRMPGRDRTRAKGQAIRDQMLSGQPTGRRHARPNGPPNAPRPGRHSGRKHRHISIGTVLRVRPAIVRSTASATFSGPGHNRPARNGEAVAAPRAVAAAAGGKGARAVLGGRAAVRFHQTVTPAKRSVEPGPTRGAACG